MIMVFQLGVRHKEHITDQLVKAVANLQRHIVFLFTEGSLHQTLGSISRLQCITSAGMRIKIQGGNLLGTVPEYILQNIIRDKGFCMLFGIKGEAKSAYFLFAHGQRGREMTQQSVHTMCRYVPNAEETQYVVYSVCIEVACHLAETRFPPTVVLKRHGFPVICGEAPVLSVHTEIIWWRTRLTVHVEQVGFCPRLHAATAYADGDIAFEHHAHLTRLGGSLVQLFVQQILHIHVIAQFVSLLLSPHGYFLCLVFRITGPGCEVACLVLVPEQTESGIGHKPAFIGGTELKIIFILLQTALYLVVESAHIVMLQLVHRFIVHLGQRVQFPAFLFVFLHIAAVVDGWK